MKTNIEELKKQAEQLVTWMVNSAWEIGLGTAAIGYTDEDDNQHEIAVFDTTMYDGYDDDSIKLAEFFAAANPAAVLELIAEIERVTKQRDELLEALKEAAMSLETIHLRSYGKESHLHTTEGMRAYAGSRASVARDAIAKTEG